MVARTLPNSRFTIAFLRGSEVFDARPAPGGSGRPDPPDGRVRFPAAAN
jgi:hypothetical protein